MRKILVGLWIFLCAIPAVWPQEGQVAVSADAVEAGNTICPLSGDAVSPKVFYVYEGKRYHFCCAGCIKKFKKDPEKYLAQMASAHEH